MAPAVHARNVQAAVVWSTAAGFPHLEVFAELQQNQVPAGWRPTNHQSFTMQLSLSDEEVEKAKEGGRGGKLELFHSLDIQYLSLMTPCLPGVRCRGQDGGPPGRKALVVGNSGSCCTARIVAQDLDLPSALSLLFQCGAATAKVEVTVRDDAQPSASTRHVTAPQPFLSLRSDCVHVTLHMNAAFAAMVEQGRLEATRGSVSSVASLQKASSSLGLHKFFGPAK